MSILSGPVYAPHGTKSDTYAKQAPAMATDRGTQAAPAAKPANTYGKVAPHLAGSNGQ